MSKNPIGYNRKLLTSLLRALLTVGLALLAACARPVQPDGGVVTTAASTPQQAQAATATPMQANSDEASDTSTATLADVQGVVTHIYRDAVVVETERSTPFIVGDFNGDDSQDIAIVVKPSAGKLPKINSEYANWIVEDPRKALMPEVRGDVKVFPKKPEPVTVRHADLLLAVIHGYQKKGWRDPLASQTYLLKNAVGDEIKTQQVAGMLRETLDEGIMPQLQGDVIRETIAGEAGFIYWNGTKYAWSAPGIH